ncbi:hypothetical protein [Corynebacterium pilosum]|uniref:hypothetical protein n=1 Tax=Corynebacterium pilosum TaxID=35756 RepID=UPI000AE0FE59
MKALSPEQLLIIADAFCDKHNVQVTSFSALVAAAAVPGARFEASPFSPRSPRLRVHWRRLFAD